MKYNLLIILLFFLNCSGKKARKEINWDPFYPNMNLNVVDLENNGFKIWSLDHGLCAYTDTLDNKVLFFLLDSEDNCQKVKLQELSIEIRKIDNYDFTKITPIQLTRDDSILIVKYLSEYKSRIVSSIDSIALCRRRFKAQNEEGIIIDWDIITCGEQLEISASKEFNMK